MPCSSTMWRCCVNGRSVSGGEGKRSWHSLQRYVMPAMRVSGLRMGYRTGVVSVAQSGTSALGGMGTVSCHESASNKPAMTTNTAGTNQNDRLRAGPDRPRRVDSTSTTCQLPRQPDGRMLLYRRGPVHVKQRSKGDRFQRAGSRAREKETTRMCPCIFPSRPLVPLSVGGFRLPEGCRWRLVRQCTTDEAKTALDAFNRSP